jgi:hypothetical protein
MHNLKSGRTLYDSGGVWQALSAGDFAGHFNRAAISSPKMDASAIGRFASPRFTIVVSRKETARRTILSPPISA